MAGYQADLSAIVAAGKALRGTADALSAALDGLDSGAGASVGPGQLGAVVASLTENTSRDLDRVLGTVTEDADLVHAAARGYEEFDQAAAAALLRRAGD